MVDNPRILGWGQTKFVEPFVKGAGGRMATHEEILENHTLPMAVSGITKNIIPSLATQRNLDWYSIDTGYFGNRSGHKIWFRITKKAHQNTGPVKNMPGDRLKMMKIDTTRFRRGNQIVLVPPDDKICYHYQLGTSQQWIDSTVETIRRYTDRPIYVRLRPASRHTRTNSDRFVDLIAQDTNAVVVYSSNCAVEAAQHGIPVVALGESAAQPITGKIQDIDRLPDLDPSMVDAWLRHLSYCQFTKGEMMRGTAWHSVSKGG